MTAIFEVVILLFPFTAVAFNLQEATQEPVVNYLILTVAVSAQQAVSNLGMTLLLTNKCLWTLHPHPCPHQARL